MAKVKITPEIAIRLLEHNKSNRPISKRVIERYVNDMKSGNWIYNGESIKVSDEGQLLDGQHRLMACVHANVPFISELIDGLEKRAFASIDIGKRRNLSDTINISGYKYYIEYAAITRHLWFWYKYNYEYGCKQQVYISNQEGLDFFLKYKDRISQALNFCLPYKHRNNNLIVPVSILSFVYYILSSIDAYAAQEFIDKLIEGHNCQRQSPILALILLLTGPDRLLFKGNLNSSYYILDVIFLAWNKFRNNERVDKLSFRKQIIRMNLPLGYNRTEDEKNTLPIPEPKKPYVPYLVD